MNNDNHYSYYQSYASHSYSNGANQGSHQQGQYHQWSQSSVQSFHSTHQANPAYDQTNYQHQASSYPPAESNTGYAYWQQPPASVGTQYHATEAPNDYYSPYPFPAPDPRFPPNQAPPMYMHPHPPFVPPPPHGNPVYRDFTPPQTDFTQGRSSRLTLATPSDSKFLSPRQCLVRDELVEIFETSAEAVKKRHAKGAQQVVEGQIGIRCRHCANKPQEMRTERSVGYPSSIKRLYNTVADMQRFHFPYCQEIPKASLDRYKNYPSTAARSYNRVSPQNYWISSAKAIGLVDATKDGKRGIFLEKAQTLGSDPR